MFLPLPFMATQLLFSIYDTKASTFSPPFSFPTVAEATRYLLTLIGAEGSPLHKHASDFTLYEIGTFDDQLGAVSDKVVKNPITSCLDALIAYNVQMKQFSSALHSSTESIKVESSNESIN